MNTSPFSLLSPTLLATLCLFPAVMAPADDAEPRYLLRYKFTQGETIRWQVEHLATVRNTVSGTSQTAETKTKSVKVWEITKVDDQGNATFTHQVSSVDMLQKLTGRQEVRYNSETDKEPPVGFEQVAADIGIPLSVITINSRGETVKREEKRDRPHQTASQVTILLPEKEVALGDVWKFPYTEKIAHQDGRVKNIKTQQRFKLKEVSAGIATISVETQVLTPIHDPMIEAQLVQRETKGTVKFDIEKGRIISQRMDLDRRVHGSQGETSLMHYVTRFTEELLREEPKTARRAAGPALPPGLK